MSCRQISWLSNHDNTEINQNEEAEDLMRKIEKEEEQMGYEDPERKIYHLCIVNLVIGILYCAKGLIFR